MTGTFMASESNFMVCIHCMTYNQSAYIADTLKGFVMQQTNFPFVAVLIDDASTDGEQEVIRTFVNEHFDHTEETGYSQWETEEAYWTFARHKENEQCHLVVVCLKRNLFREPEKKDALVKDWMNSKYIAICEGDDYWTDPLKLQKQVDFLEGHKEYSMCCTGFSQTFEGNESEKSPMVFDMDYITIEHLIKGQWIGTATVVYRRELLADYKPPFSHLPFGDVPMWFHLALKGKIKYLKDITANYRRRNESACHFSDKKKEYLFGLDVMRVREYYALLADKIDVAQPEFSKNAHYYLEQCFKNRWFDFPMDTLWHFVKEYGHPSGYDRLKYWGMKSGFNYAVAGAILKFKGKT